MLDSTASLRLASDSGSGGSEGHPHFLQTPTPMRWYEVPKRGFSEGAGVPGRYPGILCGGGLCCGPSCTAVSLELLLLRGLCASQSSAEKAVPRCL